MHNRRELAAVDNGAILTLALIRMFERKHSTPRGLVIAVGKRRPVAVDARQGRIDFGETAKGIVKRWHAAIDANEEGR